MQTILFIGEQRSQKAKKMGVHWKDGRLAAKQLFDALRYCGIDPTQHLYVNVWEKLGTNIRSIVNHNGLRVAMGDKVSNFLKAAKVEHVKITHPAARGAIRKKKVYCTHVKDVMTQAGVIK